MIEVAVTGASGRMGSKIMKNILGQEDMKLVAAIEASNTPFAGRDVGDVIGAGTIGVEITPADELYQVLDNTKPDVLVDFTIANAAVETIKIAADNGVNLVVGTTGFSDEQLKWINRTIKESNAKAVIAPNMAVGVNVFFKILKDLAPMLSDFDIEIIEAHHKHKKDAPSGTAVRAFEIMAQELGRDTSKVGVYGREGLVGARTPDEIGMHAVRGGDIVGDHTVLFAGDGERLEIIHRAGSRQSFVNGVMKAIRYVISAPEGKVSDMGDVLELK